eukprot:gnl/TRDRNA2_/TRDRNA2_164013_c1_seq2.p1 gnl/TRDRNA2_/TRDRNA2_164013_c1~~gnl/TRDRNA2_/TRDRNA2_164013_c1_seq2.p1  ORF type:complete len:367 (-),score=32.18 gnl/TRDRNA2_/TRDRNA2_164013_c1_seq2:8-1108(-)
MRRQRGVSQQRSSTDCRSSGDDTEGVRCSKQAVFATLMIIFPGFGFVGLCIGSIPRSVDAAAGTEVAYGLFANVSSSGAVHVTAATPSPTGRATAATLTNDADMNSPRMCSAMRESLAKADSRPDRQFLVFRCRWTDRCTGWGDRFAGVAAAIVMAMLTGRSLKIEWPGLHLLLRSNGVEWLYDAKALSISAEDQLRLDNVTMGQEGVHDKFLARSSGIVSRLSEDVVVMHMLNADDFRSTSFLSTYQQHRVWFFFSNRGPDPAMFHRWAASAGISVDTNDAKWLDMYQCVFHSLFAPSAEFLNRHVPMLDGSGRSLSELLGMCRRRDIFSIGLQHRVTDREVRASLADTEDLVPRTGVELLDLGT